jgi:hypothetical protein
MSRSLRTALAAALSLFAVSASAQSTGTISGVVTDESGAALTATLVEVRNQGTSQLRSATTGPDGFYAVPLLAPGLYDVKASLAGFTNLVRRGVRVSGSETSRVNLSLAVGQRADVVCDARSSRPPTRRSASSSTRRRSPAAAERMELAQLGTLIPGVARPRLPRQPDRRRTPGGFGASTAGFNVRHAEPVEQLPARRLQQQRHVQHGLRPPPAPRRDPGVQDPHPLLQRRVRAQRGLGRQRRDQVRRQRLARERLGVQPRRRPPGP